MKLTIKPLVNLYILQSIAKGYSVFYLVLLPIFYSEKFITSSQIGYIGASYIVALIIGAAIVGQRLHNIDSKKLLVISALITIFSSCLVFFASIIHNIPILVISFGTAGLVVGISMAGLNALASFLTTRGDRYKSLAILHMLNDIVRVVFPLLISGAIFVGAINAGVGLVVLASVVFFVFSLQLPTSQIVGIQSNEVSPDEVKKNKSFLSVLVIEFLDSFSSSQLFVFLPLVFLAKGYSLGNSILLQSIVFLGYMTGRWLLSLFAKRYSGTIAVATAEVCMSIVIILLLLINNLLVLYLLSYLLGIFARGTSPAIKALAFDSLSDRQTKQGAAWHVVAGDSGSALGQLIFGVLIASFDINMPFEVAIVVLIITAFLCIVLPIKRYEIAAIV